MTTHDDSSTAMVVAKTDVVPLALREVCNEMATDKKKNKKKNVSHALTCAGHGGGAGFTHRAIVQQGTSSGRGVHEQGRE